MKLSHETLKAILVKIPQPEDKRPFLVRLLGSLQIGFRLVHKKGKLSRSFRIGGGSDF